MEALRNTAVEFVPLCYNRLCKAAGQVGRLGVSVTGVAPKVGLGLAWSIDDNHLDCVDLLFSLRVFICCCNVCEQGVLIQIHRLSETEDRVQATDCQAFGCSPKLATCGGRYHRHGINLDLYYGSVKHGWALDTQLERASLRGW